MKGLCLTQKDLPLASSIGRFFYAPYAFSTITAYLGPGETDNLPEHVKKAMTNGAPPGYRSPSY